MRQYVYITLQTFLLHREMYEHVTQSSIKYLVTGISSHNVNISAPKTYETDSKRSVTFICLLCLLYETSQFVCCAALFR